MPDLQIRRATADDVEIWRALRLEGIAGHPEAFIVTEQAARDIPVDVDARNLSHGHRWLAFLAGHPVGLIGLSPNGLDRARHRGEIGPLYVAPGGRGQGVGDALITTAISHGQTNGIWQFELFVNDENVAAQRLYGRHGFEVAGAIPNAILGAGGPERDLIMILTLSDQRQIPDI